MTLCNLVGIQKSGFYSTILVLYILTFNKNKKSLEKKSKDELFMKKKLWF